MATPVFDLERAEYLAQLSKTVDEAETLLYERSLYEFGKRAWEIVEPGTPFVDGWHNGAICECLTALRNSELPGDLLVTNMPPRTAKSRWHSVFFPTWIWTTWPELREMFASYKQDLAVQFSLERRLILQSDFYQSRWSFRDGEPWVKIASDQNEKKLIENTRRGRMISTSFGGSITGFGGRLLVVDDPHDTESAASDTEREAEVAFYRQSLSTRFDDPNNPMTAVVMQRQHHKDVTGYIERSGRPFFHLKLPAQSEGETAISLPSGRRLVMEDGELLTERLGEGALERLKIEKGTKKYRAEYLQKTSAEEGSIIERRWCQKRWKTLPLAIDELGITVDCAFKDTKKSSKVSIQVWARRAARKLLVKRITEQMNYVTTKTTLRDVIKQYPTYSFVLIEDKANGPAIISEFKDEFARIIPFDPDKYGSKEARLSAVSPEFEAGNIELPDVSIYRNVEDYVEAICSVPDTDEWDDADATSQILIRWRKHSLGSGVHGRGQSTTAQTASY